MRPVKPRRTSYCKVIIMFMPKILNTKRSNRVEKKPVGITKLYSDIVNKSFRNSIGFSLRCVHTVHIIIKTLTAKRFLYKNPKMKFMVNCGRLDRSRIVTNSSLYHFKSDLNMEFGSLSHL